MRRWKRPPGPRGTLLALGLLLAGAAVVPAPGTGVPPGALRPAASAIGETAGTSTTVVIRSFSARRTQGGSVTLRWRTRAEARLVGFDVFRRRGLRIVRLTKLSVPARNAPRGAAYTYVDRFAGRGRAQYRLEAVEIDGTRVWAGSVSVR
ncbi:MAG: hypothetical protein ABR521_06845 [Gaiellaceae bacterium]